MRLNWRGMGAQNDSSFQRRMPRTRLRPQTWVPPPPYRSVANGIRISAYQPALSADVATVQVASQLRLNPPIDPDWARLCPRLEYAAALAFLGHLPVVLDARWRRGEDESVLAVVIGVEDDPEVVAVGEERIPDLFSGHDPVGCPVVEPRARRRALHGRSGSGRWCARRPSLAQARLPLGEAFDRARPLPGLLVEPAIDARRRRCQRAESSRLRHPGRRAADGVLLGGQAFGGRQQEGDRDPDCMHWAGILDGKTE